MFHRHKYQFKTKGIGKYQGAENEDPVVTLGDALECKCGAWCFVPDDKELNTVKCEPVPKGG